MSDEECMWAHVATDTVQGFGHAAHHKDGGGRNNHNLTDFRLKTEFHKEASIQYDLTNPTHLLTFSISCNIFYYWYRNCTEDNQLRKDMPVLPLFWKEKENSYSYRHKTHQQDIGTKKYSTKYIRQLKNQKRKKITEIKVQTLNFMAHPNVIDTGSVVVK